MPTRWAQGTLKGSSKGAKREPRRSQIGRKLAENKYEKNNLAFLRFLLIFETKIEYKLMEILFNYVPFTERRNLQKTL